MSRGAGQAIGVRSTVMRILPFLRSLEYFFQLNLLELICQTEEGFLISKEQRCRVKHGDADSCSIYSISLEFYLAEFGLVDVSRFFFLCDFNQVLLSWV